MHSWKRIQLIQTLVESLDPDLEIPNVFTFTFIIDLRPDLKAYLQIYGKIDF